jgi:phospholipid/cholesterol/gamma-HCH transport system ATP-binding protein
VERKSAWAWRARWPSIRTFFCVTSRPPAGIPITAREIGELIVSLKEKRKMTAVVVTHDIHGAKSFSDLLIVMRDGKVLVEGTFADLQKSEGSYVVQFLKDSG